jgi:hypothetical protein
LSSTRSESLYDTDFDQPLQGNETSGSFETGGAASGGGLAEI